MKTNILLKKALKYNLNLHLPCYIPPSCIKGFFFFKKSYQKCFSWWGLLKKISGEGYMEELMIRSCRGRGKLYKYICQ